MSTEVDWQLERQRAVRVLEEVRLCYEGLRPPAPGIPDCDEAEREVCRMILRLHKARQRGNPLDARRAAIRMAATALAVVLDFLPDPGTYR